MFRKSVSFFILVALFWVLLWVYIPDATPGKLSVTDFFRSILLLFSFAAFGFALLMLLIRNFGVDLISAWVPHAGTAWWLGQHAYQFSQPKITLQISYIGQQTNVQVKVKHEQQQFKAQIVKQMTENITIGILKSNPTISVNYGDKMTQQQELNIKQLVKRLGKNMVFEVIVDDHGLSYHNQQNNVPTADS
jgi:hypothetical protein